MYFIIVIIIRHYSPGAASIPYKVGRTPWTGHQPVARPLSLPTDRHTCIASVCIHIHTYIVCPHTAYMLHMCICTVHTNRTHVSAPISLCNKPWIPKWEWMSSSATHGPGHFTAGESTLVLLHRWVWTSGVETDLLSLPRIEGIELRMSSPSLYRLSYPGSIRCVYTVQISWQTQSSKISLNCRLGPGLANNTVRGDRRTDGYMVGTSAVHLQIQIQSRNCERENCSNTLCKPD